MEPQPRADVTARAMLRQAWLGLAWPGLALPCPRLQPSVRYRKTINTSDFSGRPVAVNAQQVRHRPLPPWQEALLHCSGLWTRG